MEEHTTSDTVKKIENAIKEAAICVAEVSTDNPNVWLELGYALALDRPCVILCDKASRTQLPFDIRHRPVIFYRSTSKSGYEELERAIVKNVKNELSKSEKIKASPLLKAGANMAEGLQDYEVAILTVLLAVWPTAHRGLIHRELESRLLSLGFKDVEVSLGLNRLISMDYAERNETQEEDNFGRGHEYEVFQITPAGIDWLQDNKNLLQLKGNVEPVSPDEIPF